MSDRRTAIRKEILDLFRNEGKRTFRPKEVAKRLGYAEQADYRLCRELLEELESTGKIQRIKGNQFGLRPKGTSLEGVLSVHPHGYGFIRVEGVSEDYYVKGRRMYTALDGDTVRFVVAARKPGDERREAEILEILRRGRKDAVGTLEHSGSYAVVVPDDRRLIHDIFVDLESLGDAQHGDKVQVSIDSFEHRGGAPRGHILKVIGSADDPSIQTVALAMSIGVDVDFPPAALEEANAFADDIPASEIRRREDFREQTVFTIDPVDAKDFDDALHLRSLPGGNWELGIHIADVAHYVRPGTDLDRAAQERGTSVYLVDRVIPMLPEHLSNSICSLNPGVDRLSFSCVVELTPAGETVDFRVAEGVICSAFRLSYEEAQEIILGLHTDHPLTDTLQTLNRMAKSLRDKRFDHGSIDFDVREVRVELDENGRPVRIVPRERRDAHRLIEEYMLMANRLVAKRYGDGDHRFVFRIHDPPDAERIAQLASYVGAFGHELPHQQGVVTPKALNTLLRSVTGRPEAPVIEEAALRSMSRARYDVENHGHYGLAADFYTHFTSPIRRYPDLLVHRLVREHMDGERRVDPEGLAALAKHCSEREQVATEAERESIQLKKVEYVQDHVGEEHPGVITGVSRFGVYIELTELLVEGMVHVRNMDDYYEYDERSFSLVGRRSGRRYRPGDPVRVLIAGADLEKREIDFEFA
ncbi:MAG: ribonuclease R [Bacteroidetes bacterium]|nr:ribonuclease R [Bacteroidota bacterium]MDA0873741.1 ribonuclease R [Bacteroidota bacterium]